MIAAALHDSHVDAYRANRRLPLAPCDFMPAQKRAFEKTADFLVAKGVVPDMAAKTASDKVLGRGEVTPDGVRVTRADGLTIERVEWLWNGYLPLGKLILIAGPAGTSKTTLALALAATVTRGGQWPDRTRADAGDVLIWSGEDGIADTLLPRLVAHQADLSRVHFVHDVIYEGEHHPFDPASDMDDLACAAARIPNLRLVLIDPVILTVRGDSNTNGDVRRGLMPLVKLAEATGAAALGITHFSKGTSGRQPVERVTGSLAFAAAARVVLAVARLSDEQGGGRIFLRAKNNLGPDEGGFRFEIETAKVYGADTVHIAWREAITGNTLDILTAAERQDEPGERKASEAVVEFLRECLVEAGGSINRRDLLAAAKQNGYSERSIERARNRLRVTVRIFGYGKDKHSIWTLADQSRQIHRPLIPGEIDGNGGTDGNGVRQIPSIPPIPPTVSGTREASGNGEQQRECGDDYRRASRGE